MATVTTAVGSAWVEIVPTASRTASTTLQCVGPSDILYCFNATLPLAAHTHYHILKSGDEPSIFPAATPSGNIYARAKTSPGNQDSMVSVSL